MILEELFYIKLHKIKKEMFHFEQKTEIRLLIAQVFRVKRVHRVSVKKARGENYL